jgi:hypothetical protein
MAKLMRTTYVNALKDCAPREPFRIQAGGRLPALSFSEGIDFSPSHQKFVVKRMAPWWHDQAPIQASNLSGRRFSRDPRHDRLVVFRPVRACAARTQRLADQLLAQLLDVDEPSRLSGVSVWFRDRRSISEYASSSPACSSAVLRSVFDGLRYLAHLDQCCGCCSTGGVITHLHCFAEPPRDRRACECRYVDCRSRPGTGPGTRRALAFDFRLTMARKICEPCFEMARTGGFIAIDAQTDR